jgi:hypothetical protein
VPGKFLQKRSKILRADQFPDREPVDDNGMNGIAFHDLPEFEKIAVGLEGVFFIDDDQMMQCLPENLTFWATLTHLFFKRQGPLTKF